MLDVGCWMLDVGCWMLDETGASRFSAASRARACELTTDD